MLEYGVAGMRCRSLGIKGDVVSVVTSEPVVSCLGLHRMSRTINKVLHYASSLNIVTKLSDIKATRHSQEKPTRSKA